MASPKTMAAIDRNVCTTGTVILAVALQQARHGLKCDL